MPGLASPQNPNCLECEVYNIVYRNPLSGTSDPNVATNTNTEVRTMEVCVVLGGPDQGYDRSPAPRLKLDQCGSESVLAAAYDFTSRLLGFGAPPCEMASFLKSARPMPRAGDRWSYGTDYAGAGGQLLAPPELYARRITFSRVENSGRYWIFIVTYDNQCAAGSPIEDKFGNQIIDIVNLPFAVPKITFGNRKQNVVAEAAKFHGFYDRRNPTGETEPWDGVWVDNDCPPTVVGQFCCRPLCGSATGQWIQPITAAGIPLSNPPLTRSETILQVTIEKPYLAVNGCITQFYFDKLNCDGFYLIRFTRGLPTYCLYVYPYTARVQNITFAEDRFCDGTPITWLRLTLEIRYGALLKDQSGNDIQQGWRELVPNMGYAGMFCAGDKFQRGDGIIPEVDELGHQVIGKIEELTDEKGVRRANMIPLDVWGRPVNKENDTPDPCGGVDTSKVLSMLYQADADFAFRETLPAFDDTVFFADTPDTTLWGEVSPGVPVLDPEYFDNLCFCNDNPFASIIFCNTTSTTPGP